MYNLFIDDLRIAEEHYPEIEMVTVRSYEDAVEYVNKHGLPNFVSFDHDLGDTSDDEKTGYSFAKYLIDYMIENNINTPFTYFVHSANPVGVTNINQYLYNGFKFIRENM